MGSGFQGVVSDGKGTLLFTVPFLSDMDGILQSHLHVGSGKISSMQFVSPSQRVDETGNEEQGRESEEGDLLVEDDSFGACAKSETKCERVRDDCEIESRIHDSFRRSCGQPQVLLAKLGSRLVLIALVFLVGHPRE